MTRAWILPAFTLLMCLTTSAVLAENEGQEDLDKATALQLKVKSLTDLEKVAALCESAMSKGLDEGNKQFATQLLTSSLYEHAVRLSDAIFDVNKIFVRKQPHEQWPLVRNLAVEDLEKSTKIDEKQPAAHLLLARLYALPGGDSKKALAAAEKAVEHSKDDADKLAMALVVRGSLQGDAEKQIADYDAAVKASPEHAEARRARGMYHLLKKDYDKATADFSKVLEQNPADNDVIAELAESLTAEKKYDDAIKQVEKIIDANPKAAVGYTARARIKVLQGKEDEGLADLNKALELQPKDVAALLIRARFYYGKKEFDKAKADVDQALKLRPGMVQGILMQTELAAQKGNYEEAIENMRMMATADPMNPVWKLQIAQLLSADKRPRAAIKIASEILEDDAANASALRIRGDANLSIGKHKEAVADLEASLKQDPKNPSLLNNVAWVLSTSPDDGVRNGKRAVELATLACEETEYKRPHIISTLAAAYAETGDFDNAVKWSTKAVELSGEAGENKPEAEVEDQLKKELESYKEKKPFRERQETEEKKAGDKEIKPGLEI
jgi:tetratricopeptide (TPR) repeat protein